MILDELGHRKSVEHVHQRVVDFRPVGHTSVERRYVGLPDVATACHRNRTREVPESHRFGDAGLGQRLLQHAVVSRGILRLVFSHRHPLPLIERYSAGSAPSPISCVRVDARRQSHGH